MNFCSHCGASVALNIPPGDTVARHVCSDCGTIHYLNPKLVVGTVTEWEGRVLLCRRAIEPRQGFWTLPAGFMENGESTAEGAARETLEEACARVEAGDLFTLINIPHINQVHLMYRARLLRPDFAPGEESLEVALFAEHEIPWGNLAFRTNEVTLRHYFTDRRSGRFELHCCNLRPLAD
jgi:ADP-ribose pyrophosphatase YjhB (NUDIX family)